MFDFCTYDEITEDREDLVCIEYPFLTLEAIDVVEFFDLFVHHLGARQNYLHFAHWSHRFLQLVEDQLALVVGL
jgi:hypothetical protein